MKGTCGNIDEAIKYYKFPKLRCSFNIEHLCDSTLSRTDHWCLSECFILSYNSFIRCEGWVKKESAMLARCLRLFCSFRFLNYFTVNTSFGQCNQTCLWILYKVGKNLAKHLLFCNIGCYLMHLFLPIFSQQAWLGVVP